MMDLSVVPYEPKKPETLAVRSPPTTGGALTSPSSYRECMRNHAASLGGRALDGCGEFMPSSSDNPLTCAACGCHRNFHRRAASPPPPPALVGFPALFSPATPRSYGGGRSRKRFRTKFTAEQKEKMQIFAEKIGWRMPRQDRVVAMEEFCEEVGVKRHVMKVWMHNNKNHLSSPSSVAASAGVENGGGGGGSGQLAEGIGV